MPLVAAVLGGALTAGAMEAGVAGPDAASVRPAGTLAAAAGADELLTPREVYERAAPAVVAIRARSIQPVASAFDEQGAPVDQLSTGSGFVIDDAGHIVTSARVVSGAPSAGRGT